MPFAEHTTVPADRSRAELERTLARYGADQFGYFWEEQGGRQSIVVGFRMRHRMIRFRLAMPSRDDPQFTTVSGGYHRRAAHVAEQRWEQATRQRWRALLLVVKAKLEAVEAGISTFEDEFLSATLLPDGSTVGDWARPQLEAAYTRGLMPGRLLALPEPQSG